MELSRAAACPFQQLIAGVAVAARPARCYWFPKMLQDEGSAAGSCLAELDYRIELCLIAGSAILIVGEVGAQIE